jgi:hypothetical protein
MGADFSMSSVPGAAAPFTGAVAFTIPKPQPAVGPCFRARPGSVDALLWEFCSRLNTVSAEGECA